MGKEKLKIFVEDISALEVNSMVVNSISGRKMPHESAAFTEIISAWVFQIEMLLRKLNIESYDAIKAIKLQNDKKENSQKKFFDALAAWNTNKENLFSRYVNKAESVTALKKEFKDDPLKYLIDYQSMGYLYKKIAKKINFKPDKDYYTAELFRLLRIQTRVACLLELYVLNKVTARDIYELRKLWELKGGFIYAQHSIQLDGDLISRFNRKVFRDRQTKNFTNDLLDFHKNNVEIAINNWQFLVKTIVEVGKALKDGVIAFLKPI